MTSKKPNKNSPITTYAKRKMKYILKKNQFKEYNTILNEFLSNYTECDEMDFLNEHIRFFPFWENLCIHNLKNAQSQVPVDFDFYKEYDYNSGDRIIADMFKFNEKYLLELPQIIEFIENKISEIKHKPELKQVPEDAKHIFTDLGYTIFEIAKNFYENKPKLIKSDFGFLWYYLEKHKLVIGKLTQYEYYLAEHITDIEVKARDINKEKEKQLENLISLYIKYYF